MAGSAIYSPAAFWVEPAQTGATEMNAPPVMRPVVLPVDGVGSRMRAATTTTTVGGAPVTATAGVVPPSTTTTTGEGVPPLATERAKSYYRAGGRRGCGGI